MGRKCSVYGCRSGYKSSKDQDTLKLGNEANTEVKFFRFPKGPDQRRKWVRALPNNLKVEDITDNMTVCSKHFPPDVQKRKHQSHWIPVEPPTLCLIKEKSCCSAPQPKARPTKRSLADSRRDDPDKELWNFLDKQKFKLDSFCSKLQLELSPFNALLVWGLDNKSFSILSVARQGPVYNFAIHCEVKKVSDNYISELCYEAYSALKRVRPKCLHRDTVTCWEQLQILLKAVCAPCDTQADKDSGKFEFITRQIALLNSNKNMRLYSSSDLCQAFASYACSRALYIRLREYLQLPSLSTLRMLTRKAKNIQDLTLFSDFLTHQEEKSRGLILIFDEVYVKATLTYRGECKFIKIGIHEK